MNVVAPRRTVAQALTGTWRYRELLVNLVRKELKVRYKNSSLGFFWSMLNPLMYLVVFYVVFQLVLGSGVPYFAVFLLSGLLGWNLFSASLAAATGSITGNASLVNKVWFPREILPLASIGANFVHFLLQSVVLVIGLLVFRFDVDWGYVWLVLLAWVWMTPIIYPWALQATELADRGRSAMLTLLNPMTPIVITLQRALYGIETADDGTRILPVESSLWYLRNLGAVAAVSVVLLLLALRVFTRVEGDFAEEL